MKRIVIIGGGHATAQLCASLVEAKQAGQEYEVAVVSAETEVPYQRPPLSKAYIKTPDAALTPIRARAYYDEHGIALHLGETAVSIDRAARSVALASGKTLAYDWLILATGSRARKLPGVPDATQDLHYLRNAAEAAALRAALNAANKVVVVGGGFIGLEVAATARGLGKDVLVLESAPRLLARALSPEMSGFLLQTHRAAGIEVRLNARLEKVLIEGGKVTGVAEAGGDAAADLILAGIGAEPEIALAKEAGLETGNGIVVDAHMRTSDPQILAVGDCTLFPLHGAGRSIRLESVQNANDQARTAIATIGGQNTPYTALPWFWSEQGAVRVQIAGLAGPNATRHLRGDPASGKFSVLLYENGKFAAVESANLPADHLAARKLLESGVSPAPEAASNPATALKDLVPAA
ncbi:MAG: FAD-dependent oxidoreductase [Candidatus Protistobacter heckmanni]|nr:FAD-dependent oxidoreductase [Candidatus Protistobacter heckmanni]